MKLSAWTLSIQPNCDTSLRISLCRSISSRTAHKALGALVRRLAPSPDNPLSVALSVDGPEGDWFSRLTDVLERQAGRSFTIRFTLPEDIAA